MFIVGTKMYDITINMYDITIKSFDQFAFCLCQYVDRPSQRHR